MNGLLLAHQPQILPLSPQTKVGVQNLSVAAVLPGGEHNEEATRFQPAIGKGPFAGLVGIITQRNLYKIKPPRKSLNGDWLYDHEALNQVILEHAMTKDVYALSPDNSLGKALIKMVYSKFGCIPIVEDDNTLCGIITRRDFLKLLADAYESKSH